VDCVWGGGGRAIAARKHAVHKEQAFDLAETMRFDPRAGVADVEAHLGRLKTSADALGFRFDRHDARNELQAATFRLRQARTVRLALSVSGAIAIESVPPVIMREPVAVVVRPRAEWPTSHRTVTQVGRVPIDAFETIYEDAGGFLTDGALSHLYVRRDGRLATPPASRTTVAGVLRSRLLASGEAVEEDLVVGDLKHGFLLGSAGFGMIEARLL
jgi:para-aminobenzoate synthetase / 4-amino-4-deoxychorismate lyase